MTKRAIRARMVVFAPELLAACKALLEEHRLFPVNGGWRCPFCAVEAPGVVGFPHAEQCPVVRAREVIRKVEGRQ